MQTKILEFYTWKSEIKKIKKKKLTTQAHACCVTRTKKEYKRKKPISFFPYFTIFVLNELCGMSHIPRPFSNVEK